MYTFSFINLETTPELWGFLSSVIRDVYLPNVYTSPSGFELPERFSRSKYDSGVFLSVFGHTGLIWFISAILLAISVGLKHVKCSLA